jgi:hypothetical protein
MLRKNSFQTEMVPVFDPQILEIFLYERTVFEISFRSVRKKDRSKAVRDQ